MADGKEEKLFFMKICLGGGAVLLVAVIVASFIQEFINRKLKARKTKRIHNPGLCTSTAHDKDPEAAQERIRNNLVVKKYERDDDDTMRTSDSSFNMLSSQTSMESPKDLEANCNKDGEEEGSVTESSSEESQSNTTTSETRAQKLQKAFRSRISSLNELIEPPPPQPASNKAQVDGCSLCQVPFQHGDYVCESNNPRCTHMFHQECITSWLSCQNTCPTCSETFVVLDLTV